MRVRQSFCWVRKRGSLNLEIMVVGKDLDFTSPMKARKWLRLLREDNELGFVLPKNYSRGRDYLGFDFSTNELGLRGPSCLSSGKVILGTSYAMGFSVNDGENWYDMSPKLQNYLNLGMPVGIRQMYNRLLRTAVSNNDELLFLYHPNILTFTAAFENAHIRNQSMFDYFKWKKGYFACLKLAMTKKTSVKANRYCYQHHGEEMFRLDTRYCILSAEDKKIALDVLPEVLSCLFKCFRVVRVVRCHVKEEIAAKGGEVRLRCLDDTHQENWAWFSNLCKAFGHVHLYEPDIFEMEDYMPLDTHWSRSGNQKFTGYLNELSII